jgi:hypothetical protein
VSRLAGNKGDTTALAVVDDPVPDEPDATGADPDDVRTVAKNRSNPDESGAPTILISKSETYRPELRSATWRTT